MSVQEIIDSGILEMYCLGIASDDEKAVVEELMATKEEVRNEIAAINNSLAKYATNFSDLTSVSVKKEIFDRINTGITEPGLLGQDSSSDEWLAYLDRLELKAPSDLHGIIVQELPASSSHLTMVLWGSKGALIPDEEHEDIDEHFLVCRGSCEMTIDGVRSIYSKGDYLCIHRHHAHSGIVISDENMTLIVQRRAA